MIPVDAEPLDREDLAAMVTGTRSSGWKVELESSESNAERGSMFGFKSCSIEELVDGLSGETGPGVALGE